MISTSCESQHRTMERDETSHGVSAQMDKQTIDCCYCRCRPGYVPRTASQKTTQNQRPTLPTFTLPKPKGHQRWREHPAPKDGIKLIVINVNEFNIIIRFTNAQSMIMLSEIILGGRQYEAFGKANQTFQIIHDQTNLAFQLINH